MITQVSKRSERQFEAVYILGILGGTKVDTTGIGIVLSQSVGTCNY
jgi:hypothetical protein